MTKMCFESPILKGTGAGLIMAGAEIFRYGKRDVLNPLFKQPIIFSLLSIFSLTPSTNGLVIS